MFCLGKSGKTNSADAIIMLFPPMKSPVLGSLGPTLRVSKPLRVFMPPRKYLSCMGTSCPS